MSAPDFSMSVINEEPVDPCISGAITTGRPEFEIVVADETVVETDHNGPFVKDVASLEEEFSLDGDPVCFLVE